MIIRRKVNVYSRIKYVLSSSSRANYRMVFRRNTKVHAFLVALICAVSISTGFAEIIQPNDHRFRYVGRFTENEDTPRFSWSASQIKFKFNGPAKIYANLSGSLNGDRFLVFVDENHVLAHQDFLVQGRDFKNYLVVDENGGGIHTAVLWKATEDLTQGSLGQGSVSFGGLVIPSGCNLFYIPQAQHRLEFIGDSDTAGYCVDGESLFADYAWLWAAVTSLAFFAISASGTVFVSRTARARIWIIGLLVFSALVFVGSMIRILFVVFQEDPRGIQYGDLKWTKENSHSSWATQLALALSDDVDIVMQAITGVGVMQWPMQRFTNFTLGYDPSAERWNFRRYTPEAVLILLGPNDPSLAEPAGFLASYLNMLDTVVANYAPTLGAGEVLKIINVCGGSGVNGLDPCALIQEASCAFNADPRRVEGGIRSFYVAISESDWKRVCYYFWNFDSAAQINFCFLTG